MSESHQLTLAAPRHADRLSDLGDSQSSKEH
jgi:hypothetical protein